MLQVLKLTKSFGSYTVLDDVSLLLNAGEHAGLTGPNGCGKSTLLRCVAGVEAADRGRITLTPGARLGYLAQESPFPSEATVAGALDAANGDLRATEHALHEAMTALAEAGTGATERYDAAVARFEAAGGYPRIARGETVLSQLGLGAVAPEALVATLSGGEKTRFALACLLLSEPDLLLLDEPTNHLDIEALEWLEGFLAGYHGAVLVVSHDREFLDRVTNTTFALDGRDHTMRRFVGNYSASVATRAAEAAQQARQYRVQQEYIAKVQSDVARLKGEALNIELNSTPRQPGVRVFARKKAGLAKARERKLERFIDSADHVEKPRGSWSLKVDFGQPGTVGREAIRVRDLAFAYGGRPRLLEGVSLDVLHGDRIVVTGPNGAGKTTLLRLLDGRLAPGSGAVWRSPNVRMATLSQEMETLDPDLSVLDTVRRARKSTDTDARNFLHLYLFAGDAALRRVGLCSPGERARLQLALAVVRGANVLSLDEPLNHLDIESRVQFEAALTAFEGTVIAVSHDRRFIAGFPKRLVVGEGAVRAVEQTPTALIRASARGL